MAQNIFVAMPFKHSLDPVLDVIKDAGRLLNTQTSRLDEHPTTGSIVSHIRSQIAQCDLMVAVVSEENGNVYYEIGLAHCQKKPVVLLTTDPSTLKFDLRDHRTIVYDSKDPNHVRDELVRTMKAALDATSDPTRFIESAYGSAKGDFRYQAQDKVLETVVQEAHLQRPAHIISKRVISETRELSIEVEDFFGSKVRAIFDVNGILRLKKDVALKDVAASAQGGPVDRRDAPRGRSAKRHSPASTASSRQAPRRAGDSAALNQLARRGEVHRCVLRELALVSAWHHWLRRPVLDEPIQRG